ncbi:MAG: NifU family protein [Synergistales bacterium]|jgi:Fe-S cluster biogenesis protein NfuA|nr:NifU family protein [Bacteroidales bacterium]MDY6434611.1 NifU family protein [Synergistales bacterium]MBQ6754857.1 NifU family protein [Bacteroidales bacterium]MDY6380849.1 NifU family protein [Bacteroidales bacterium]MDY6393892.1 NifU family protein [Bacteroidales bacterium]
MTTEERNILEAKVKNAIEQIRPYLQEDGGDIAFVSLTDDKIVNVELQGHCGSCPYAMMTLKQNVELAIKDAIPEIVSVENIKPL